jgi:hypothetical protein
MLWCAFLLLAFAPRVRGDEVAPLSHEPFEHTAGQPLVGRSGASGFSGSWLAGVPGAPNSSFQTAAASLPYPGLKTGGGHVRHSVSGASGVRRAVSHVLGQDNTVRYISLLVRPDGALGSSYFGLRLLGGVGVDLYVGKPGGGNPTRYVIEGVGGAGQSASAREVVQGEVALLVIKLEFRPGADRVSLYVNPPLGTEPAVADAVKADQDLGRMNGLAFNSSAIWSTDELRVGTTFASVTPAQPDFELQRPISGNVVEHVEVRQQIATVAPLPAGRTLTFSLVDESYGALIDPVTGVFTWTPGEDEQDQRRTFRVRATSNATPPAFVDTTFSLTVAEGNLPPVLDPIPDFTVTEGSTLFHQLRASDPDRPVQTLGYDVLSGPEGLKVSSTGVLSWTPSLAQAGRSFPSTIQARDIQAGRTSRSFVLTARSRDRFSAYWIAGTDGDWNNPANWDIGRVPNDNESESFHVILGEHPVTIRVSTPITIQHLTWRSGATLELVGPEVDLVVRHHLRWTDGTLSGSGRLISDSRAELEGLRPDALGIRDTARWAMRGTAELASILSCGGTSSLVVESGASLGVSGEGALVRGSGIPEMINRGNIRIWGSGRTVPWILLRNHGGLDTYGNTVQFRTGSATDLIQESGGRIGLGAGTSTPGGLDGVVQVGAGSSVIGRGRIQEAQVAGTLDGILDFQRLSLASTAVLRLALTEPRGRINVAGPVQLAGRLVLGSLRGQAMGGQRDLVRASGGVTGQFVGMPLGARIPLPDGAGTALLSLSGDAQTVRLGGERPPPVSVDSSALTYRLAEIPGSPGGCRVIPHSNVQLPEGNWAGGSVTVTIVDYVTSGPDRLEFNSSGTLEEPDGIQIEVPVEGAQEVRFHDRVVGTARIAGGQMTCVFNDLASREAVAALLGRVQYANTELDTDWYDQATNRYPDRSITVELQPGDNLGERVQRPIDFPYLVAIRLPEYLLLPERQSALLELEGVFSSGQVLYVRQLQTVWSERCYTDASLVPEEIPTRGVLEVIGALRTYCCTITAKAESLTAVTSIRDGTGVALFPSGLYKEFAGPPSNECPLEHQIRVYHKIGSCETTPGGTSGRTARPSGEESPVSPVAFHALEGLMKQSVEGRRWASLYRAHGPEVVQLFMRNPMLVIQAQRLLATFRPGVVALLAGDGRNAIIHPPMILEVQAFWEALARDSSPSLKAVLERERIQFDDFERFRNLSFEDWAGVLGLTPPSRPRLHIFSVRRESDRVRIGINDQPTLIPTLWRSTDLTNWVHVAGATLERDGDAMMFTDPQPPADEAFYTVRE